MIVIRNQVDTFIFKSTSVGKLKSIALAHIKKEQTTLIKRVDRDDSWHCKEVIVKDLTTDASYTFAVSAWLDIGDRPAVFELSEKSEIQIAITSSLENMKYEISVVTGDEKGAGTGK